MTEWIAVIVAGGGVLLLAGVLLAVLGPVRRFGRASASLRSGTASALAPLRALMNSRRPGDE